MRNRKIYEILFLLIFGFLMFNQCKSPTLSSIDIEKIKTNFTTEELEFFSDVAFNNDMDNSKTQVKRWEKDIRISLCGEYTPDDSIFIHNEIILILNQLLDNVKLVFASYNESNFKVYFIDYNSFENFNERAPMGTHGYGNVKWNAFIGIFQGYALINKANKGNFRKRTIKEEITQCLGLPADSYKHPESIFYQLLSENYTYAEIDKKLICLLYNYNLPIGMTEQEFEFIFL